MKKLILLPIIFLITTSTAFSQFEENNYLKFYISPDYYFVPSHSDSIIYREPLNYSGGVLINGLINQYLRWEFGVSISSKNVHLKYLKPYRGPGEPGFRDFIQYKFLFLEFPVGFEYPIQILPRLSTGIKVLAIPGMKIYKKSTTHYLGGKEEETPVPSFFYNSFILAGSINIPFTLKFSENVSFFAEPCFRYYISEIYDVNNELVNVTSFTRFPKTISLGLWTGIRLKI